MTTAILNPMMAPIAMIYSINDGLVLDALKGLKLEELWRAPTARNNAMLWVAGHAVQTRAFVLGQLGLPYETGWGELFDRGATVKNVNRYPLGDEIERVMRDVSSQLQERLASLDDEYMGRPATVQVPGAKTIADQIAFFALHDSYHVGQMAYIRKALGYPGIAG